MSKSYEEEGEQKLIIRVAPWHQFLQRLTTPCVLMIRSTSRAPLPSSPARVSLSLTFDSMSNSVECKPAILDLDQSYAGIREYSDVLPPSPPFMPKKT